MAQIAVDPPDAATLAGWLAAHTPVAHQVANDVSTLVRGDGVRSISGAQFVGRRIRFDDIAGAPLFARVYTAKAGSGLTVPGWPDAIVVGVERDANGALDHPTSLMVEEAGSLRVKDTDGSRLHRQFWPLEDEPSSSRTGSPRPCLQRDCCRTAGNTRARWTPTSST